jgi:hypothetical protein
MLEKLFRRNKNPLSVVKTYDDEPVKILETVSKDGVEVFRVGTWNGDIYTKVDLQSMVDAFDKVGFEPFIKAGHEPGQEDDKIKMRLFGEPALGYVKKLYLKGDTLLADLKDIPKRFANLINTGAFKRISAEIYWNWLDEASGKTYPRVLKAIAFLGAKIPALTNLKEIESLYQMGDDGRVFAYDDKNREFRMYCMDCGIPNGMSFNDYLLSYPRKEKSGANYSLDAAEGKKCGECRFWIPNILGACTLVEGSIEYSATCDYFEALNRNFAKDDKPKVYMIEKKGDEWCVKSEDGKELGCHPTEEKAKEQLAAIEAAKHKDMNQPDKDGKTKNHDGDGGDMTKEEIAAMRAEIAKEVTAELSKSYDAKVAEKVTELETKLAKERETAKAEAEKEYKARIDTQDAQLKKLESQRRSDGIANRIKDLKSKGKLPKVWENRLQAVFEYLPEEAAHTYSNEGKEVKESVANTLWGIFENSPEWIFRQYTLQDKTDTEGGYDDAQIEVGDRAKKYMKESGEKDLGVAMSYVLKQDKDLADDYERAVKGIRH